MGDTLQTDIQRAILGIIIVELIAIIILLSICIKFKPKKKHSKKEENITTLKNTRSMITLPPFLPTESPKSFKFQSNLFKTSSRMDVAALTSDVSTLTSEGSYRDRSSKSQDSELSIELSDEQRVNVKDGCSDRQQTRQKKMTWCRSKSFTVQGPGDHRPLQNNNSLPLGFML